jgi:hypothetical protein
MTAVRDMIDVDAIRDRLGKDNWMPAEPLGEDAWTLQGPGRRIIVSVDLDSEPGTEWLHASVAYKDRWRLPSYSDLKQMHAAVFPDGHAYQCFVPPGDHVNITTNVLHLWGRLDGANVLPDFGRFGTI